MSDLFDVMILGGGPAGCAAGIYCARAGLSALILEALVPGGQMAATDQVENYPGLGSVLGWQLGERMKEEAERFGTQYRNVRVTALELNGPVKTAVTPEGAVQARAVILATGADARPLGVPEEEALRGRGLSYCATCDGMFFRGKTAAVVGGGSSAAAEALLLTRLCVTVYLIHRRDTLRCDKSYLEPIRTAANLHFIPNAKVTRLLHDQWLTGLELTDTVTGKTSTLSTDAVFVAIGRKPNTELVQGVLDMDEQGYLAVDETTRTAIPGVFAAGDLRQKPLRQILTATADGAVAARAAEEYLSGLPK